MQRNKPMMLFALAGILDITYSSINAIISGYGYLAIFVLMALEAASFPVPSEVVLPAVGYLVATGKLNLAYSFVAVVLGSLVGMTFDYYVAYFLGKEVVYKHLHLFHIKRKRIEEFDEWFAENGRFTVFISRLLPVVRGLINFPAGFAEMSLRDFYAYSLVGVAIWGALLMAFGYYALSMSSTRAIVAAVVLFAIVMWVVYVFAMKRIRKSKKR